MTAPARGIVVSAPSSGCGKTLVTLGLIAALKRRGARVNAAKSGPDYIDTAFLAAASGSAAVNLDAWAMRESTLKAMAARAATDADVLVVEGAMGLFDGAAGGRGSTAALAAALDLPVILVIDARGQSQSAAAIAQGFARFDERIDLCGVILNRVAGRRHESLMREGFAGSGVPVLGAIPRVVGLAMPSRHLGLVQARETDALPALIDRAAELCLDSLDLDRITRLARMPEASATAATTWPPPGQRIAVAEDDAFAFAYAHVLDGWRDAGAELMPFSPLVGDGPAPDADAVYLPGGYPELHAGRIAGNAAFMEGLNAAATRGAAVFGECGGYMVLGRGLIDAEGHRHAMAGLLDLETSFADRKLHLGYRQGTVIAEGAGLPGGSRLRGHEFHYARTLSEDGEPFLEITDAAGTGLGRTGLRKGTVAGSFLHLIDTV